MNCTRFIALSFVASLILVSGCATDKETSSDPTFYTGMDEQLRTVKKSRGKLKKRKSTMRTVNKAKPKPQPAPESGSDSYTLYQQDGLDEELLQLGNDARYSRALDDP